MPYIKHDKYPSVTTILQPWADFSKIDPIVLANAARRGTNVHAECTIIMRGLWSQPTEETAPYVESFKQWLPQFEVLKTEFEVVDEILGVVGHPDVLGRFKGDKTNTLIDLKTPLQVNKMWRPQLAGYKYLCNVNGLEVDRICSLRLSREGKYPIINDFTKTYNTDLVGFLNAFKTYKYFKTIL